MSHDGNNVGGETPPTAPAPASYAKAARSSVPSPSFTSPPSKHPKKCEVIFRESTLPNGMNLHVTSISPDTLIFGIPRKVASENNVRDILIDTYPGHAATIEHATLHNVQYEVAPKDPLQKGEMLLHGLTIKDKTYRATVPTPAVFEIWKANYRYMPVHYGVGDILKLFSAYGRPLEIGAYHLLSVADGCKYPTQEGYVLFEKDTSLSHPPLPSQIVVGRGLPISTKIADPTSSPNHAKPSPKNKDTNITPSVKDVQKQPNEGFQEVVRKRTAKKRRKAKKAQAPSGMDGIIATSPSVQLQDNPHAQDNPQPQQVNNPPNTRPSYLGSLMGVAASYMPYGSHRHTGAPLDSDSEETYQADKTAPTPPTPTPQHMQRSQRKRHDGSYNLGELSRQSLQPSQH